MYSKPSSSILHPIPSHPSSRTVNSLIHIQQRTRLPALIQKIRITNILIPAIDLIPRIPKHPLHKPRLFRKPINIPHELARLLPTRPAPGPPRRNLRHPKRLIAPLRAVVLQRRDHGRGARVILVDIIRGEKRAAAAGGVELVMEFRKRVRGDGRHELGFLALRGRDQGRDCRCGLRAGHGRRVPHVGVVRLVEGQHPVWFVAGVHDGHGGGDV